MLSFLHPILQKAGIGWANFLLMRRTHGNLNEGLEAGPQTGCRSDGAFARCIAKRLYAIAGRKQARHGERARTKPAGELNGAQTEHAGHGVKLDLMEVVEKIGAGDGTRTRDVQLGKLPVD